MYCIVNLFLLAGCSKNEEELDCNCAPQSTEVKLKIGNQQFKSSLYDYAESPYKFWSIKNERIEEFYYSLTNNKTEITSIFLFSNNVNENTLKKEDIEGYVTLEKNRDNKNILKYSINIYKKESEKGFVKINKNDLNSYYLSFNDISDVNNVYFETSKNIIYIKNPNRQFKGKLIKSSFQEEINDRLKKRGFLGRISSDVCVSPCPSHKGNCYEGMDPQNEYLAECSDKCLKEEIDDEHDGKDPARPVSSVVLSPASYSFRDDYLYQHPGGDLYVEIYYQISKDFNYTNLDYAFAVRTVDLLLSIMPKIVDLTQNPFSSNVLYTSADAEEVIEYLDDVKNYVNSNDTKDNLNLLIQKIIEFEGATNDYITNHLEINP
ncbi:hypothetical protein P3875_04015 [Myroides sp. JBRI-B21084]|uniref:hypothetical protein n=1 Tax=Myroides sp. JBRI-B21084 TaxID=3119977 RepID=UPI0026E39228|nr:hypothetical protein [Paenimyroides cloacae]WKW47237.1 hypothetical protein P3875_04015 [Paenimyroides cloacae]